MALADPMSFSLTALPCLIALLCDLMLACV